MQLKNNQTRNEQIMYRTNEKITVMVDGKEVVKKGPSIVEFIHIPGGATVEIEDALFKELCTPLTRVEELVETLIKVEGESDVLMGKDHVMIKDYNTSGKVRHVNLLKESIRRGELLIVVGVEVTPESIDAYLTKAGVPIKDMDAEAKLALYNKLA